MRKDKSGDVSFLAQVRVRRFKPAAKTFKVESTRAEAKQRAIAWAEALERELRQQSRVNTSPDTTQLTIAGLVSQYLKDPETQALRTYKEIARLLEGFWVNKYATTKILDFGVLQLREARDKLNNGMRAPGTVNRHLGVLRSAWSWARAAGLIPMERVWPTRLMLTEPDGRTRHLDDEELQRLLDAVESDPILHAPLIVSLAAGVRQGEVLALTWADIDLAKGHCTLRRTKNKGKKKNTRLIYLPPSAVAALQGLRKRTVVSPTHVFLNQSGGRLKQSYLARRWQRVRKAAKLVDFKWHDLRHSCASIYAQNGASLPQIGSVLGHKSHASTNRYAHMVAGKPVTGHDALDAKLHRK
jgi:integrase